MQTGIPQYDIVCRKRLPAKPQTAPPAGTDESPLYRHKIHSIYLDTAGAATDLSITFLANVGSPVHRGQNYKTNIAKENRRRSIESTQAVQWNALFAIAGFVTLASGVTLLV